jgi:hypothetical protein
MTVIPTGISVIAKKIKKRFYVPRENPLRAMAFRFVDNGNFKRLILLLIFTNSIILALWEPIKFKYGLPSMRNTVVEVSELPFQIVFTAEMVLKMFALGFVTKVSMEGSLLYMINVMKCVLSRLLDNCL